MEVENRGYKCGYFWQKWGGFRVLGSGHTAFNEELNIEETELENSKSRKRKT